MRMRAPPFWSAPTPTLFSRCLQPLSWIYQGISHTFQKRRPVFDPGIPVICVGNLVMGGAGKTPVVAFLATHLKDEGAHVLSRGYGRRSTALLKVGPQHTFEEVGDEPLLLSQLAPVWVGTCRQALARRACDQGAQILLLDDGFQNPSLRKTVTLLVVDGTTGFGNERLFPAGPLREPLSTGLARADALIVMGEDERHLEGRFGAVLPFFKASFQILNEEGSPLPGARLFAFAGIGAPEKFFRSLEREGAVLAGTASFPDHHAYEEATLRSLEKHAQHTQARLVTTEKDWMRLSPEWRLKVQKIRGQVVFEEPEKVMTFVRETCSIK